MKINKVLLFSTTVLACGYYSCLDALNRDGLDEQFKEKANAENSYFRLSDNVVQVSSAEAEGKQVDVTDLFSGIFQLAEKGYFDSNGFDKYLEWYSEEKLKKEETNPSFKLEDIRKWRTLFFLYMLSRINDLDYDFFGKKEAKNNPLLTTYFYNMIGNIEKYFEKSVYEDVKVKSFKDEDVQDICHNVYKLLSHRGLDLRKEDMLAKLKSNNSSQEESNKPSLNEINELNKKIHEKGIFNTLLEKFNDIGKHIKSLDKFKNFKLIDESNNIYASIDVTDGRKLTIAYTHELNDDSNFDRFISLSCVNNENRHLAISKNGQPLTIGYNSEQKAIDLSTCGDLLKDNPFKDIILGANTHISARLSNICLLKEETTKFIQLTEKSAMNDILLEIFRFCVLDSLEGYSKGIKDVSEYINSIEVSLNLKDLDALRDLIFPYRDIKTAIGMMEGQIARAMNEINGTIDAGKNVGKGKRNVDETIKECQEIIKIIIDSISTERDSIMDFISFSIGPKISLLRLLTEGKSINLDKYRELADYSVEDVIKILAEQESSKEKSSKLMIKNIDENNKINRLIAVFRCLYRISGFSKFIKNMSFHDFIISSLLDIFPDFKEAVDEVEKNPETDTSSKFFFLPISLEAGIGTGNFGSQNPTLDYIYDKLKWGNIEKGILTRDDIPPNSQLFLCYDKSKGMFYLVERKVDGTDTKSSERTNETERKIFGNCAGVHDITRLIRSDYTEDKDLNNLQNLFNPVDIDGSKTKEQKAKDSLSMLEFVLYGKPSNEKFHPVPYSLEQGGSCFSNKDGILHMKDSTFCGVPVSYMSYATFGENETSDKNIEANAIVFSETELNKIERRTELRQGDGSSQYSLLESKLDDQYKYDFANLIVKISNTLSKYIDEKEMKDNEFEIIVTKLVAFASALKYIQLSPTERETKTVYAQAGLLVDKIIKFLKDEIKKINSKLSASELEDVIDVLGSGGIIFDSRASRSQGFCINEHTIVAIYKALVYMTETAPISSGVELSEKCRSGEFDRFPLKIGAFSDIVNIIKSSMDNNPDYKAKKLSDDIWYLGRDMNNSLWHYYDKFRRYNYNDGVKSDQLHAIYKSHDCRKFSICVDAILELKKAGLWEGIELGFVKKINDREKGKEDKDIYVDKDEFNDSTNVLKTIKGKIQEVLETFFNEKSFYPENVLSEIKTRKNLKDIYDAVIKSGSKARIVSLMQDYKRYYGNIDLVVEQYEWYRNGVFKAVNSLIDIKQRYEGMESDLYYDIDKYFHFVNNVLESALFGENSYKHSPANHWYKTSEMAPLHAFAAICYVNGNLNPGFADEWGMGEKGKKLLSLCYEYEIMYNFNKMLQKQYNYSHPDSGNIDAVKVLNAAKYIEGIQKYVNKSVAGQKALKRYFERGEMLSELVSGDLKKLYEVKEVKNDTSATQEVFQKDIKNMADACFKFMAMDEARFISSVKEEIGEASLLSCVYKTESEGMLKKIHNLVDAYVVKNYLLSKSVDECFLKKFKTVNDWDNPVFYTKIRMSAYIHALQDKNSAAKLKNIISNAYYELLKNKNSLGSYRDDIIKDIVEQYQKLYRGYFLYQKNTTEVSFKYINNSIARFNLKGDENKTVLFIKAIANNNILYSLLKEESSGKKIFVVCTPGSNGSIYDVSAYNLAEISNADVVKAIKEKTGLEIEHGESKKNKIRLTEKEKDYYSDYLFINKDTGCIGFHRNGGKEDRIIESEIKENELLSKIKEDDRKHLKSTDFNVNEVKLEDENNKDVLELVKKAISRDNLIKDIIKIQQNGNDNMRFNQTDGLSVFPDLPGKLREKIIEKIKKTYISRLNSTVLDDILQSKDIFERKTDNEQKITLGEKWEERKEEGGIAKQIREKLTNPFSSITNFVNSGMDRLDISKLKDYINRKHFQFAPEYRKIAIPDAVYLSILKNKIDVLKRSPYSCLWYNPENINISGK